MKLHLIEDWMRRYRRALGRPGAAELLPIWTSQRLFQERWDLRATDLAAMYDRSLDNPRTRRLWNRRGYEPKRAMLTFLAEQPEIVRGMFEDLFNEGKAVDGRCGRFAFYCGQLLEDHRERRPKSPLPDHFHGEDYHMISLYLAFRFPERYAPYDFDLLRRVLEAFQAPRLPLANDLPRYFKLMGTLQKLLEKDGALMDRHRERLDPDTHYAGPSRLLPYDFARFVAADRSGPEEG